MEKKLKTLQKAGMVGTEDHSWIPDMNKLLGQFNENKTACSEVSYGHLDLKGKAEKLQLFWAEQFKKKEKCTCSEWTKLVHLFMLLQPSSACVERAFSLLRRICKIYGNIHHDYLESKMMLIYNSKGFNKDEDLSDENIIDLLKEFSQINQINQKSNN